MALKAIISCVPYVGGSVASILGDYYSDRKEKRYIEFLESFKDEICEKQGLLIRDYIDSEDFLDVFENILRDIMNTRTEEKRTMLRNLLVNSCTVPNTTYERTEEFQHLIDVLSPTSLVILSVFYSFRYIKMDGEKESIETIWNEIRSATNTPEDMDSVLLDYIGELETRCLIEAFRNNTYSAESGTPLVGDRSFITEKGIAFFMYVTQYDKQIVDKLYSTSTPKTQIKQDIISPKDIDMIAEEKFE